MNKVLSDIRGFNGIGNIDEYYCRNSMGNNIAIKILGEDEGAILFIMIKARSI